LIVIYIGVGPKGPAPKFCFYRIIIYNNSYSMKATPLSLHQGGNLESQQDLVKMKESAIRLLQSDNRPKARSIRHQIESIDLTCATTRQLVRFRALCLKVSRFYEIDLRQLATTQIQ
jgi:hypothetical protein